MVKSLKLKCECRMYLNKLTILNFKNIAQTEIDFSPKFNCFIGENGSGKTNLLDSVYMLSMCKSSVGMSDLQCVMAAEEFFMIDGVYNFSGNIEQRVTVSLKKGESKNVKFNGRLYERLSDHIGVVPVVLVCPYDTGLINDSGDDRRKYLNALVSQIDRNYLYNVVRYNKLLAERNRLLKQQIFSDELLDVLDMQLADVGQLIYQRRKEVIEEIAPVVTGYYSTLADGGSQVELSYRSQLNNSTMSELLQSARERDRIMQHTTVGIHRDDLVMTFAGRQLRRFGSQGEQKSFLIALKLAQYDVIADKSDVKPILLLDDIFDKLDASRVERLIKLVSDLRFGQIFITDSNKVRLSNILSGLTVEHKLWQVSKGEFEQIK